MINLNKYFYGKTEFSPFGCHFLLRITGFRAFASGCTSLECSFLAYSADVSWLFALSSMFFAVTWIFYQWIQHHALHKHHDQAMIFQWNLLHGLRAYVNLVEWFSLASICDSKPVSHGYYCLNMGIAMIWIKWQIYTVAIA